jgi:hypothetical protein
MVIKQHPTLIGSDLHDNIVDATTSPGLTMPSETIDGAGRCERVVTLP